MMGRFLGMLSSDSLAKVDEIKVGHFNIPAEQVVAADPDGLIDGYTLKATASEVTAFLAEMPCAMNLTMVCSNAQAGKATVYGKNVNGDEISEEFTLNGGTPVAGAKAFARVSKIAMPIKTGSETIDVGWGTKFGLPYKLVADELVFIKLFDLAADAGTVTPDAGAVEKNVYVPNGTPDGDKALDFYILV